MSFSGKWLLPVVFLTVLCTGGCVHKVASTNANPENAATKIAPMLTAAAMKLEAGAPPTDFARGMVRADTQGRLQVYVHLNQITAAELSALGANGLAEMSPSVPLHVVQGWIKPQDLDALAALPFVTRITPPSYGRPD